MVEKRVLKKSWRGIFALLLLVLAAGVSFAETPRFNLPHGVTPISRDIYHLHMTLFWICVAIALVVFSFLIFALVKHRKSRGVKPAEFHENTTLEVVWAIVPFIILVIIAIPATLVLVRMSDTRDAALTIKVTAYQWKWHYQYLDQGISFFSNLKTPFDQIYNREAKRENYLLEVDKPLVVPIHKKIRFLITSNDVIHSWWVPAFGVKKDAIPGFIHESWAKIDKPGVYRGQCAELCGVYHAFMPIVVEAVTQEEFRQWVAAERQREAKQQQSATAPTDQKTYSDEELMVMGKANYEKYCAACHQLDGRGISSVFPALHADSVVVGASVTRNIDIVLNGVPGTAMQAFGRQLNDTELASIITYIRNAWGNQSGDVVQASDIAKARNKGKSS